MKFFLVVILAFLASALEEPHEAELPAEKYKMSDDEFHASNADLSNCIVFT